MNRIDSAFADLKNSQQGGLMPFVCAGSPTVDALPRILPALERGGASIVEIGIPFSDPIADGPIIAAAMHTALEAGCTPEKVFEQVASVRDRLSIGLVAMVSVSLVQARGIGPFVERAAQAGFDGFIFPDAPLEESAELVAAAAEKGLTASLLVAPTTSEERAAKIAQTCTGFVYLLARAGITGERSDAPDVASRVAMLRHATSLPIACGFGISTAEHIAAVVEHADAAIVGSALVRRLTEAAKSGRDPASAAEEFLTELSTGLVRMP
jgi:tryptophan synthase alpha chain